MNDWIRVEDWPEVETEREAWLSAALKVMSERLSVYQEKLSRALEKMKSLERALGYQHEEWETLAYRHLRDTANKEEIEWVLLSGCQPHEIDIRMKSIIKDIYPDPGFSPE